MRNLIVTEFVSLDGVIQAPGGPQEDTGGGFEHGGWVAPCSDDVLGAVLRKQMDMPFDLLLGRRTFEMWAQYWPQHEDIWPGAKAATKYVASNTVTSSRWRPSVFLSGDIAEKIVDIKQQRGPHLHVWGSGNLVQTLLKNDLVDELWLKIYPLTLGKGTKLFDNGTIPAAFTLTESSVTPRGVIVASYKRAGKVKTDTIGA